MTKTTQKQKTTGMKIYKKDLKWLKRRKLENDDDRLADAFREVRKEVEQ